MVIEKATAALLLAAPNMRAQPHQKMTLFEGRADRAALNTRDGLRILRGLECLLNYSLLAICVVGHFVRSCTWARRADGSGLVATCVLHRCVGLLVDLAGPAERKCSMSAPHAAHFCTLRNGTMTRPLPPVWRNVLRPCSQNAGRVQATAGQAHGTWGWCSFLHHAPR